MFSALLFVAATAIAAPDIYVISVDTLRADRLGCYGYTYPTSPNLDKFAGAALLFEDCVTEVPLTSPSFGAMMTSRYPRMNGAARNGLPLPEDVPTAAQLLQTAGYQTICVQSNWTLKSDLSGLGRGFDTYDENFSDKRWGVLSPERYADDVTASALKLIKERDKTKPLFAWIHFSDPHAPYRFHKEFNPGDRQLNKLNEVDRVRAEYDSEVAYTDHHIQQILDQIPNENAYVFFIADHGESLHEHNYLGHGRRIYQNNVHIPLIIRGPGITPGRTSFPARGIDVAPTLLAFAGIAAPQGMIGIDLIKAEKPGNPRPRIIETYGGAVPRVPGAKAVMASRPPMRQGILLNEYKLILNGNQTELFNIQLDKAELKDLSKEQPERVSELKKLIDDWDEKIPKTDAEAADLTKDDVEALESLGYVE